MNDVEDGRKHQIGRLFIKFAVSFSLYCIFAYNSSKFVDDIDKHEMTVRKGEFFHVKVEPFLAWVIEL